MFCVCNQPKNFKHQLAENEKHLRKKEKLKIVNSVCIHPVESFINQGPEDNEDFFFFKQSLPNTFSRRTKDDDPKYHCNYINYYYH